MDGSNQNYMEKSKAKRKSDYIDDLCEITRTQANKLTVKQLKTLVAKYEIER